jgi:hypothetical protein
MVRGRKKSFRTTRQVSQQVVSFAASGLPYPIRRALEFKSISLIAVIALPFLLTTGVVFVDWSGTFPRLALDPIAVQETREHALETISQINREGFGGSENVRNAVNKLLEARRTTGSLTPNQANANWGQNPNGGNPGFSSNTPFNNNGFGTPNAGSSQFGGFSAPNTAAGNNGFAQPNSGFNQPQSGFGQPANGFGGQPQSSFGQPQSNFGQPQNGFAPGANTFTAPNTGLRQSSQGFAPPANVPTPSGFPAPTNYVQPTINNGYPRSPF